MRTTGKIMSALVLTGALLNGLTIGAAETSQAETKEQRSARMKWWRDARFGMFIHWGLYAVPAGQWEGKPVPNIGEWIMNNANIPVERYEQIAKQFNPAKFNAADWVRTAKNAGIQYIVITSKHHDGFCLFNSKATDYNVAKATPYAKDLLKPLAAECRKQGLHFCTYYSIMDWHHPAQYRGSDTAYNPTKIHPERKAEYIAYMKQQLTELVKNLGTEVLWFDGEWPNWWTEEDARDIYSFLRHLKPSLIINNRVGKGRKGMEGFSKGDQEYAGDFGTPEQQIPATGLPGVDWESCMTMNDTWGFKADDHNWKSAETLIRNLIDIASKGGNYLLNVGPTAEGLLPAASVERLQAIGAWMKINGDSIHRTLASPFAQPPWGRCTRKSIAGGNTRLYLQVFNWPTDAKLVVPALPGKPLRAHLLAGDKKLDFTSTEKEITITLPAEMPDKIATVIELDIAGQL